MSEEKKPSFINDLKNKIIAGATVALTTAGTVFVDEIKTIVGIAPEIETVVEQPQKPQEIVINMPEQKPVETKTIIVKEVEKKPKVKPKKTETEKRKESGFDW